jgi:hypothetical protein
MFNHSAPKELKDLTNDDLDFLQTKLLFTFDEEDRVKLKMQIKIVEDILRVTQETK